jgi:TRAP-type uncharacterized transport system substrate-binding protein
MTTPKKSGSPWIVSTLVETFGLNPMVAVVFVLLVALLGVLAVVWFVRSAPPRTLAITSGPPGSSFQRYAGRYAKILADNGVTLQVLPSQGSLENLQRLQGGQPGIDIGFVQGGLAEEAKLGDLVSLGSIAHQPLWIFYHGPKQITRLSELAGLRIGVGPQGSGTHALAMALLKANGITDGQATFAELDAEAAATALLGGKLDAIFLMGDSAPLQTLRSLIRSPDVQLFSFAQADAYVRKFAYLYKMAFPQGSIDLGLNLPAHDVVLVGPTVELVARRGLNPALSDLLLEAAQEVHGKAGLLQQRGEFPAPIEHEFTISDDAVRYYKSGRGFMYRTVHSFWLASLINRILVVVVPTLLVLIPTIRFLPIIYKLKIRLQIYRRYRRLLQIEREIPRTLTRDQGEELARRLDVIDEAVNHLKVPASCADQFYFLRGHIAFVRERLRAATPSGPGVSC